MSQSATSSNLKRFAGPILGVVIAIAATTTMDASGLGNFSAFVLLPLMFLFSYLDRISRLELGFRWGRISHHTLAILYPAIVMGAIAAIAVFSGVVDLSRTNGQKALLNLIIVTTSTFLVVIITEEGFFRGWLWSSLRKRNFSEASTLILTSIAFALWHISAATLDADFKPPGPQVPVFLVNAAVMGIVWGLLRAISGSIVVASVSHGIWNGLAYVMFGFGTRTGALGITNTAVFGPEIGILGLTCNLLFAILLWRWWKSQQSLA